MKLKTAVRYTVKPVLIAYGITFLCSAVFRILPFYDSFPLADELFFFLAGVFTFLRRTDLLMQFGVSREKQYLCLLSLLPLCLLAGLCDTILNLTVVSPVRDIHGAFFSSYTAYDYSAWYSPVSAAVLYGLIYTLRNAAALFMGSFLGILLYRFSHTGSRWPVILPVALTAIGTYGGFLTDIYPYPYGTVIALSEKDSVSTVQWVFCFWQAIFLHPFSVDNMPIGDVCILSIASALCCTVFFAALCCILLRRLPARRDSHA